MVLAIAALAGLAFALTLVPPPPLRGDGRQAIDIVPLKTFWTLQSKAMLWIVGLTGVPVTDRVDCYRIVYPSTDENGKPIRLSGLLALPHGRTPRGLVSFQHGTTSDRDFVPSNLSTDGLAAAILFAGNGYATIAPDYIGLGVSRRPHPYYVAADSARAVIDMIHAVRHIAGVPGSPPFLIGFSEGAYANLAVQRALEAGGEPVLADAAIAGAYNLRAISIPFTLQGNAPSDSVYLALWVRGYATRYGHKLQSAFTPYYAKLVPELFDTPHSVDDVVKALPRDPRALFLPVVLDAIAGKGRHWLVDALNANEMGDWAARAPIRFYYGSRDVDVRPLESIATARQMAARGSRVLTFDVGPSEHNQSVLAAAPLILTWLQTFPDAAVR